MPEVNKQFLVDFEKEIADIYATGAIKAPVHLRSGREEALIDIFNHYNISDIDWVFGYWDSHELALLKGVPRNEVRESILQGNSIALCYPKHNMVCSGIVGSLVGVAVGVAWRLKQAGSNARVFHFCGEMSAETGIFHEAVKYATNQALPVWFVVGDNDVSVMTKTREAWGDNEPWFENSKYFHTSMMFGTRIIYFKYTNGYPHSGLGKLIKF